jgi:hypothetical protein
VDSAVLLNRPIPGGSSPPHHISDDDAALQETAWDQAVRKQTKQFDLWVFRGDFFHRAFGTQKRVEQGPLCFALLYFKVLETCKRFGGL